MFVEFASTQQGNTGRAEKLAANEVKAAIIAEFGLIAATLDRERGAEAAACHWQDRDRAGRFDTRQCFESLKDLTVELDAAFAIRILSLRQGNVHPERVLRDETGRHVQQCVQTLQQKPGANE